MREFVITRLELVQEVVGGYGGLTSRGWHSYVRAILEDNGFDLSGTVEVHEDFKTASYTYRQKESTDNATRTKTTA